MTGCADVTKCSCPPFFFFCSIQNDPVGTCTLTEAGIWLIIGIVVLLAALVLIFCVCCCCCKCMRSKSTVVQNHYKDSGHIV